jgi:hypothetical protein
VLSFLGSDRFRYVTPRYFRYLAHTVYVTPLIMGLASAYLFAAVPQMQEIYLGIVEDQDFSRGLAGLAAVSLFSALLYAWNHTVVTRRIDSIYPDHADIYFDRGVIGVRDLKTTFASSLPFLGLLFGLLQVYLHVEEAIKLNINELNGLSALPRNIAIAACLTVAIVGGLIVLLYHIRKAHWHRYLLYFCYSLTVIFILVPSFASNTTLLASRYAGPLASTALVLIEIAVVLRALFWLFQLLIWLVLTLPSAGLMSVDWVPFALRQGLVGFIPVLAIAAIAIYIVFYSDAKVSNLEAVNRASTDTLTNTFEDWLKKRNPEGGYFPVFIVAAQGGGIYAASSAAAFLATMQDHCPAFAKHVFAISAVSGGSVGATLFDAALAEAPPKFNAGCSDFGLEGKLAGRLRTITQDDHMSPVLAYLLPDVIRGLGWGAARKQVCIDKTMAWLTRDQILEKSFIYSFAKSKNPRSNVCPDEHDQNLLLQEFLHIWPRNEKENKIIPTLILNSTWVDTGYSVAFSPIPLREAGKGTLYSLKELRQDFKEPSERSSQDLTLIEAAVVSARFPVIMPPWVLDVGNKARLTFVDGGYADSSGAETALQVYNGLKYKDAYLITLTDKPTTLTDQDVDPVVRNWSSWFYDFFSPVNALLSVRDLQSRKAVTEAHSQLGDKNIVIRLDQKAFPLPLGWKLSNLSSDIIRFTLGAPESCANAAGADPAVFIGLRNSCEIKKIADLLTPNASGR